MNKHEQNNVMVNYSCPDNAERTIIVQLGPDGKLLYPYNLAAKITAQFIIERCNPQCSQYCDIRQLAEVE